MHVVVEYINKKQELQLQKHVLMECCPLLPLPSDHLLQDRPQHRPKWNAVLNTVKPSQINIQMTLDSNYIGILHNVCFLLAEQNQNNTLPGLSLKKPIIGGDRNESRHNQVSSKIHKSISKDVSLSKTSRVS
jgi:hypothetical protein